jgi:hypothetical protein
MFTVSVFANPRGDRMNLVDLIVFLTMLCIVVSAIIWMFFGLSDALAFVVGPIFAITIICAFSWIGERLTDKIFNLVFRLVSRVVAAHRRAFWIGFLLPSLFIVVIAICGSYVCISDFIGKMDMWLPPVLLIISLSFFAILVLAPVTGFAFASIIFISSALLKLCRQRKRNSLSNN